MKIAENTDSSENNYTGYRLCFDEGSQFGHTVKKGNFDRTTNAKNVIIFGVDMSSSVRATNRPNNIYVMGKDYIVFHLLANGRQELKFKAKDDQIINEKLCLGNLSSERTTSESEKTGVYGNMYDFVVDYKPIVGVDPIDDMHRYLMTKHNISP